MPNIYVYAANNPSESILAKRRGYGTIVSHNVSEYILLHVFTSNERMPLLPVVHGAVVCFISVRVRKQLTQLNRHA
jgi:CobN/Magnesium Chelatase